MVYVPDSATDVLGVDSPIQGEPDSARVAHRLCKGAVADAREYHTWLKGCIEALAAQKSKAVERVVATIEGRLTPGCQSFLESARHAEDAFNEYANDVERIHHDARDLHAQVESWLEDLRVQVGVIESIARRIGAPMPTMWSEAPISPMPAPSESILPMSTGAEETEAALRAMQLSNEVSWNMAAAAWARNRDDIQASATTWSNLIDDRRAAERRLMHGLQETELGRLIQIGAGAGNRAWTIAASLSGEVRGHVVLPLKPETYDEHLISQKVFPNGDGSQVWDNPPDPADVAEWWATLDPKVQQTLIKNVPWVIGNLPGLPFGVRAAANQNLIEFYDLSRRTLSERSRSALDHIKTLQARGKRPLAHVIALDLSGAVPMAAMGYGNLDTADNITWQVPGMNSDADHAILEWDHASRNLYREQAMLQRFNSGESVGVIAFLSYDTPDLSESLDKEQGVLGETKARLGARRFASELDGTWATRNSRSLDTPVGMSPAGAPRIAVVAHSYGTTMAADALASNALTHSVDSVSFAGSAGIDLGRVRSLDGLKVSPNFNGGKSIYASHAAGDTLAPIGLYYGARGNPNANMHYDGRMNLEGAMYYPSDGGVDQRGQVLKGTDGHSVRGTSAESGLQGWGTSARQSAGFEATTGHGYWDRRTQSLRNLGASSLGLENEIVGLVR